MDIRWGVSGSLASCRKSSYMRVLEGSLEQRPTRVTASRLRRTFLQRNFAREAPNRAWASDITFLPTTRGWLYLAVIIDLFSRRVVGWATSENIDRHLVLAALK